MKISAPLVTKSYFDDRPDARFFVAHVGEVIVSIRENLPTYGVTDGEVWAAWRSDAHLVEHRFVSVVEARRHLGALVCKEDEGLPTIVPWTAIPRKEYAVSCPVCKVALGGPCLDDDEARTPMLASKGRARISGAPWRPEPHDVAVDLAPLVHAGRIAQYHQSLHCPRVVADPKTAPPGAETRLDAPDSADKAPS
jgi:hypothetical protein